jgi:hypothetical protein
LKFPLANTLTFATFPHTLDSGQYVALRRALQAKGFAMNDETNLRITAMSMAIQALLHGHGPISASDVAGYSETLYDFLRGSQMPSAKPPVDYDIPF